MIWRIVAAWLLALVTLAGPVQAYPSETYRQPPIVSEYYWFAGDVTRPATLARALIDSLDRFPYTEPIAALTEIRIWQDARPDTPASLFDRSTGQKHAGTTWWLDLENRGRIELNGQWVPSWTVQHELGHVAQHFYRVLPAGHPGSDWAGAIMHRVWVSLPGPDGEEDWAEAFASHLRYTAHPFYRWFPDVLALWRSRPPSAITDALVYQDGGVFFWQWWDSDRLQLERYQDGRHLAYDWAAYRWMEI